MGSIALNAATEYESYPGVLEPVGFFDPLGLADKADPALFKKYREAELTHGRVAMLATIGFLIGEKVEGSSFLFDASISGPAISHIPQVPSEFWVALIASIGAPGQLLAEYTPGDLGFDPLGLMPEDPEEFFEMQTKELQNGRLAMLAAAGFPAQEAVDGKGIFEHFSS